MDRYEFTQDPWEESLWWIVDTQNGYEQVATIHEGTSVSDIIRDIEGYERSW